MNRKSKWNPFEHQIYRLLKDKLPSKINWLIGSSGGLDSVALMHLALQMRGALGISFRVAHFHHGKSPDRKTNLYRAKAQKAVAQWCAENQIEFVTEKPALQIGYSEDDFRRARQRFFRAQLQPREWLVMAHHQTDLFETRVLRLLRGVGPQGLEAMKMVDKKQRILRPLLLLSREKIEIYAKQRKLSFVVDPSNATEDYLRNWLRNTWLKSLEKKSPGSSKAWARSLQSLAELAEDKSPRKITKISRKTWPRLARSKQRARLAQFLLQNGFSGYGQTHIEELVKRLDTRRKRHTFELLGRTWHIDPEHLALQRDNQ